MPHDKNGQILTPGLRAALTGIITEITSDAPTFCNVVFRPDIGMAPELDGAAGPGMALSARMLEKITLVAPSPVPFLFIRDYGPSTPVIFSGGHGYQFVYDPVRNFHVRRYPTRAAFEAEQEEIIKGEQVWKILTGFDPEPAFDPARAGAALDEADEIQRTELLKERDELSLQLATCLSIAEGYRVDLDLCEPFIATSPTVKAVAALFRDSQEDKGFIAVAAHAAIDEAAGVPAPLSTGSVEATKELEARHAEDKHVLELLGELTPELIAKYAAIIEAKSGRAVVQQPATVQIIRSRKEFDLRFGIGFSIVFGVAQAEQTRIVRQGVEYSASMTPEGYEKLLGALAEYFRNPDSRLCVDDDPLDGHTLPLLFDGNTGHVVSVAPMDSARPETALDPAAGTGAALTEAARTLGNHTPEGPKDSAAGKTLAAAAKDRSHKKGKH